MDEDIVNDLADTVSEHVGCLRVVYAKSIHNLCGCDLNFTALRHFSDRNESPSWLVTLKLLVHFDTDRLEKVHALEKFIALGNYNAPTAFVPTHSANHIRRKNREWQSFDPA